MDEVESILAHLLAWGVYAIIVSILSLMFLVEASAQTAPPLPPMTIIVQPGQTQPLNVVAATPFPTPTPVPSSCISITSPAPNVSVSGSVPIQTVDNCSGAWFERLYVDGVTAGDFDRGQAVWNTIGALPGAHVIAVVAQSRNPSSAPLGVAAQMLQVAAPPPTPTPTSTPTPLAVIPDPAHPDNQVANNTVPPPDWMASFKTAVANGVGPPGCPNSEPCEIPGPILQAIDPSFVGTTDQILAHYAMTYSIDPDLMRADAMQETTIPPPGWHQNAIGDIGNGISLGILQIKSHDYPATCPTVARTQNVADVNAQDCMSHLSTPFATAFRAAHWGSCMQGGAASYFAHGRDLALTTGHHPYPVAVANGPSDPDLILGCLGAWFSGAWEDSGSIAYQQAVQKYYSSKPWLNSALLRQSVHKLIRPANRFARRK